MRKKLIIIISLVLLVSAFLVFFTPKEKGVLYYWDFGSSLPSYSHSGEEWKTFGGLGDKWVYGILKKIGLNNFLGWMEEGKYVGGTTLMNTVTPCYFFPDYLLGFNNLIFSCTVPDGLGTFHNYGTHPTKYVGEWSRGEKHGQGKYTEIRSGIITEGTWKEGIRWDTVIFDSHGNLKYKYLEGEMVIPQKKNEFSNGKYEGEWKDLKWHGEGTFTYPDGRKYKGGWKNWLFNGHGTFTFPDGSNYIGEWKDGEKHGKGTHTFVDGEKINGQWREGRPLNCTYYDKKANIIGKWENEPFFRNIKLPSY